MIFWGLVIGAYVGYWIARGGYEAEVKRLEKRAAALERFLKCSGRVARRFRE